MSVLYFHCVLTNNEENVYIKYNLILLFVNSDACAEQNNRREIERERVRAYGGAIGNQNCQQELTSVQILDLT